MTSHLQHVMRTSGLSLFLTWMHSVLSMLAAISKSIYTDKLCSAASSGVATAGFFPYVAHALFCWCASRAQHMIAGMINRE